MKVRATQCCSHCKASCQGEFKQVVNLKISGLLFYVYNNTEQIRNTKSKNIQSVVIHNIGNKEIKKFDYVVELCQYKTKCFQCQRRIQCIRNLLDDINVIRKNEVLAVCEHCKRSNFKNKCKRCQYLLEKFILCRVKQNECRLDAYRSWCCSVKNVLQSILENRDSCENRLSLDQSSDPELNKLVSLIKTPSPATTSCRLDTVSIKAELGKSSSGILEKESISKIEKIIDNLDVCSEIPLEEETPCMCRYFIEHKKDFQPKVSLEIPAGQGPCPPCKLHSGSIGITASASAKADRARATKGKNKSAKRASKASTKSVSEDTIILRLIKQRNKTKTKKEAAAIKLPHIESLPVLRRTKKEMVPEDSESILECAQEQTVPNVMIRGTKIVPLDPNHNIERPDSMEPLFFRRQFNFTKTYDEIPNESDADECVVDEPVKKQKDTRGILRYRLSNREFIDKGWTKLPSIKIMRKMNIYKMIPTRPEFDWFQKHRHDKVLFYDSGEILAEIYENGCGRWFYKNGLVALDYFNSEDINVKQRYIIYGCNDEYKFNTKRPVTILACFDHLGYGIVYDDAGKVRLKYNQSEGIIIDEKISPPSRWKWHALNEPPVFENAYIDNKVKINEAYRHLLDDGDKKSIDEDIVVVEFENFVKAKAAKMLQKFKPYQIRPKIVKINDFFSLRIIDQANIYVLYRIGHVSLKLNIGMLLKSDEIIDSEIGEVSEVITPYDSEIKTSPSICKINEIIDNVKKIYKSRN